MESNGISSYAGSQINTVSVLLLGEIVIRKAQSGESGTGCLD